MAEVDRVGNERSRMCREQAVDVVHGASGPADLAGELVYAHKEFFAQGFHLFQFPQRGIERARWEANNTVTGVKELAVFGSFPVSSIGARRSVCNAARGTGSTRLVMKKNGCGHDESACLWAMFVAGQ